ncbi:MAG: VpsF family polysaccharide biosynthesis protein [Hyphomicrobiaceae bacterium]
MQASAAINNEAPSTFGTLMSAGRAFIVVSLLAVSPLALYMFGWQYFDTGGSPLEKFHPATLAAGLVLLMMAVQYGNPLTGLIEILGRHQPLLAYFAANLFMIVYAATILKLPVTIFIETFIGAALIFIVLHEADERIAHTLALLIHALIFINAALGFYELVAGFRLTPLVVNGEDLLDEPRSTALMGHPLANAMLMGTYIVMLVQGGARDLPNALRPICFLVALASLIPFGGRAATAATLAALGYLGFRRFLAILAGAEFEIRSVLAGIVILPLAAFGLAVAFDMGAFDTLTNRLFDDDGSAGTRIEMFALFRYLSAYDLIFGPDTNMLMTWVRLHGLEYGIESFVIAFILNYGLLCTVLFFPPFALFLTYLKSSLRPGTGLVILHFLAVALTSISLSSKSPAMSIFVLLLTILMRPNQPPDAPASA